MRIAAWQKLPVCEKREAAKGGENAGGSSNLKNALHRGQIDHDRDVAGSNLSGDLRGARIGARGGAAHGAVQLLELLLDLWVDGDLPNASAGLGGEEGAARIELQVDAGRRAGAGHGLHLRGLQNLLRDGMDLAGHGGGLLLLGSGDGLGGGGVERLLEIRAVYRF